MLVQCGRRAFLWTAWIHRSGGKILCHEESPVVERWPNGWFGILCELSAAVASLASAGCIRVSLFRFGRCGGGLQRLDVGNGFEYVAFALERLLFAQQQVGAPGVR